MPTVKFGTADNVVEPAKAKVDIAVLEEPVDRVEHKVKSQDLVAHADQDEWQRIKHKLQRLFDGMKASDVEPIEFLRRVMYRVEPPK